MKNPTYFLTCLFCFVSSVLMGQCDVELFITNNVADGDNYSFDIEMRSNMGDLLLGDSDFNIVDADGNSDFTGSIAVSGISGVEVSGGGTAYTVNFSAPPAFSTTIGATNTTIATVTINGYEGGTVQLEWNEVTTLINYFDTGNGNRQEAVANLCFSNIADQVLPVELTSFTVREKDHRKIQLDWETSLEEQNAGFEIQHSLDGTNWQVLDFVVGKGDSQTTQTYQFLHQHAPLGNNYYRLKQMDVDGAFEYSKIESIQLEWKVAQFVIYPNPSTDIVNVHVDKEEVEGRLQLVDQKGRTVGIYTLDQYTSSYTLQLGNFPSGVYYLSLSLGENKYTKRLVLQH